MSTKPHNAPADAGAAAVPDTARAAGPTALPADAGSAAVGSAAGSTAVGPRIAVVGDALIDEIHGDRPGDVTDAVGGAALNVAIGVARLGLDAQLVAMVGDDADGRTIRTHLARYGVQLVPTIGPNGSSRAVATKVDGEPYYEFNLAARRRRIDMSAATRAALAAADYVVISCFPLDDAGQRDELLGAVADRSRRLIVDPNPRAGMMADLAEFRRGVLEVARASRLIKIGEDDARYVFGCSAAELTDMLLDAGATAVVATAGADGARVVTAGGQDVSVPVASAPGPLVDAIGAGDATLAALVAALARAESAGDPVDWAAALGYAMRVAAATCRVAGGLLQLPGPSGDESPAETTDRGAPAN